MKELWFGAWQNFYDLSWPVRFLIEWTIFAVLIILIIKFIQFLQIPQKLFTIFVFLAKEAVYLIGRKKSWAIDMDIKLTEWGNGVIKGRHKDRKKIKTICFVLWAGIYAVTIFTDLPVSSNFESRSIAVFYNVKSCFSEVEGKISHGYEDYPPLLKKDPPVLVRLNKIGKKGPKIRKEPFVEGEIIDKVSGKTEIHYKNKLEYDGERYWLKVYLPDEKMEGWLNGKLIEKEQLQHFLEDSGN